MLVALLSGFVDRVVFAGFFLLWAGFFGLFMAGCCMYRFGVPRIVSMAVFLVVRIFGFVSNFLVASGVFGVLLDRG